MENNPIASNDAFKAAIKQYIVANNLGGPNELAKEIGRPRKTVEDWYYRGLTSEKGRRQVVERYPQLFSAKNTIASGQADVVLSEKAPAPPREDKRPDRKIVTMVKVEVVRGEVAALAKHLEGFLYQATPDERNQFRDALGEEWKRFLELCRAMTGETAFQVAKDEGRLS